MRVLVVTNLMPPEFLGGYELGCAQMASALSRRGHDVAVLTSSARTDDDLPGVDVSRRLDLAPVHNIARMQLTPPQLIDRFHQLSTVVQPVNVRILADAVRDYQPDVVYLWNLLGLGGLGLLGLLKHLRVPWTWHIMDIVPRLLCGLGGDAIPQLARYFSLVGDGTYIVCSTRVAAENEIGGATLGEDVHLVPNWVTGEPKALRTNFFAGGELRLMCAVGELGVHKGIDILIESAALLQDRGYANFTIDIYGHERDLRFRRMLHEFGLEQCVRLRGSRPQPELLELYPLYDVFVFPTWPREPFGFAPLEAAAYGCVPLFPADCGIAEWLVGDVHCLKAPRTAEAFADRLEDVLLGKIDLAAVARRAQSVATSDFHVDVIAGEVERILALSAGESREPGGTAQEFCNTMQLLDGLLPTLVAEAQN
jgi:glycogen(starch) synthase